MERIKPVHLLFVCGFAMLLAAKPSAGQNLPAPPVPDQNLGINISQSYHGDHEDVNLAMGNLYIEVPLLHVPGRNGHDLNVSLSYNSQVWNMFPSVSTVNSQGQQGTETFWEWTRGTEQALNMPPGWFGLGSQPTVMRDVNVQVDQGTSNGQTYHQFCTTNYRVLMPDGSIHHFPGIKSNCYADSPGYPFVYTDLLVGDTDFKDPLWLRYDVNNGLYASNGDRWGPNFEDTNGNLISSSPTNQPPITYTDTAGRNVQLSYQSGALYPNAVTYKDSNGVTQTITLNYLPAGALTTTGSFSNPPPVASTNQPNTYAMAAMTCSTSNPCSWGPTLSSLVLPNGLTYTLHYNNTFGELDQITYPSGGYTRYEYATFQRGIRSDMNGPETPMGPWDFRELVAKHVCRAPVVPRGTLTYTATGTVPTNTCPVPEDTTTYSPTISVNSVNNASTTVTDSLGNVTVVQFLTEDPYETKRQIYDNAGHLLRTVDTAYTGTAFLKASETVTLNNGLISKTEWDYQSAQRLYSQPGPPGVAQVPLTVTEDTGNVTEKREFDYAQGAPGPLLRKTDTAWAYATPGAPFNNRKTGEIIYDGSGNLVAQTTYEYDNYTQALVASGATQHDSAFGTNYGTRGNLTATSRWLNTTNSWLTTRNQYDDAGNVVSTTDPGNHTTSFSYADSWNNTACPPSGGSAAAYVTHVTNALNQSTSYTYNSCTGTVASMTDVNNKATSYGFDALQRLTVTNYADTGQTSICYSDMPGGNCYSSSLPLQIVATQKITASLNKVSTSVLDGLGRTVQTQLSDSDGTDYVDTTYDSLGRVLTVSNPHRSTSSPTDGSTCNGSLSNGVCLSGYDALGRLAIVTRQDGNTVRTDYSGYPTVTVTDEAGRQRQSVTDALGRLITVVEPNYSSGSLTSGAYHTYYTYDLLGNLTYVNQQGDGTQSARNRAFTYDSLSRLLDATNPETGRICYGTVSGSTCNRDGYDVDGNLLYRTDARGIRTTYGGYDALHRLGSKSYSDTTPAVSYFYDQTSYNGLTIVNGIGRRTGMSDGTGQTAWSYDAVGNVLNKRQTINGVTNTISHTFNLDHSVGTLTSPNGHVYTYGYNSAARPLSLSADNGSITYAQNAHYAPPGELTSASHGLNLAITESNSYNSRLQPATLSASSPSTPNIMSFTYSYDQGGGANNGDVMQITNNRDTTRSTGYQYDYLNRLKSAQTINTTTWGDAYVYDSFGNLLQKNVTQGTAENLQVTVNANNQITGGWTYDAAGNMTWENGFRNALNYDAEDRLNPVTGYVYSYDGDDHRVEKNNSGSITYFWYDDDFNVISSTGAIWRDYVYFNGRRIAELTSDGNQHYYWSDRLGSASVMSNSDGSSIQWEADYYPFGTARVLNNFLSNYFRFTDYQWDPEMGYYYAENREQSPNLGRFFSPDPIGGHLEDPQTFNKYSYVRNNPTSLTDPTGLDIWLKGCGKDSSTCKNNYVGTTDDNGNFTRTHLTGDQTKDATLGTNGITVTQDGKQYQGVWDTNKGENGAVQVAGTGAINGYTGTVNGNCGGTCVASGFLKSNDPNAGNITQALFGVLDTKTSGYVKNAGTDGINFFHLGAINFRGHSPGDPAGIPSTHIPIDPKKSLPDNEWHIDRTFPYDGVKDWFEHAGCATHTVCNPQK